MPKHWIRQTDVLGIIDDEIDKHRRLREYALSQSSREALTLWDKMQALKDLRQKIEVML